MARIRQNLSEDDELLRRERELRREGFAFVAGVDEAGRGPLAGPVFAAAVILPWKFPLPGVFDSKQLSDARRRELRDEITAIARVGLASVTAEEIDEINILQATHLAMRRAVEQLKETTFVLVDGLPVKGFPVPCENMVKGDARSASIAAASIVAKVARDEFMESADLEFPGYGFAQHKGYGTASHLEALRELGPSPLHRRTFTPVRMVLEGIEQPELF